MIYHLYNWNPPYTLTSCILSSYTIANPITFLFISGIHVTPVVSREMIGSEVSRNCSGNHCSSQLHICMCFHNAHYEYWYILSHIMPGLCYFLCLGLIISWISLQTTALIDSILGLCYIHSAPIKFIKINLVTLSRNVLMSVLAVF